MTLLRTHICTAPLAVPLSCFTLRLDCLRPGMFPCLSLHLSQWPASFYARSSISHPHPQLRSLFWGSDLRSWLESSAWMSHREPKLNKCLRHSVDPHCSPGPPCLWPFLLFAFSLLVTAKSSTNPVNSMSTYHLFISLWFLITHHNSFSEQL